MQAEHRVWHSIEEVTGMGESKGGKPGYIPHITLPGNLFGKEVVVVEVYFQACGLLCHSL